LDVPYRCTFVRGAGRVNIEPTVTVSQEYQRWRERYDAHNAETNTIVKEALDHGVRSERDRDFLFGVLLPNILREACRRVSKISKTDLDELVQNTMVKIVTKDVLGNMPADARQNVRAYFATVAKNALIDSIRELRRRRGREEKGARPEAIEETPRAPTDVGAVAASALRRAFFSLTSSERAVLVVHFHDGLSGAEAAERLQIGKANPEDAAYQAKRRAISAMCNRLRQDDVFALAVAVVMRDREQSNAAAGELLGASVMEAAGAVLELVPDKLRELVTGMLKVSTWKLNGPDGLAPCFSLD
jgi:RNA polymerase sigma factor (sigma-70 family)